MTMQYPVNYQTGNQNGVFYNGINNQLGTSMVDINSIYMQNSTYKPLSLVPVDISKNNSIYNDLDFIKIKSSIDKLPNFNSLIDFLSKAEIMFTNIDNFVSFKYKSFFFTFHTGNLSAYELDIFFKINFGNSLCIPLFAAHPLVTYPSNSIIGICWEDIEEKVSLREPLMLFKLFQKLITFHYSGIVFNNLKIENFYFSKNLNQWILKEPSNFIIKNNLHNLQISYNPKNILKNLSLYSKWYIDKELLINFEEMKNL